MKKKKEKKDKKPKKDIYKMANYPGKRMYPNAPGISPVLDIVTITRLTWFPTDSSVLNSLGRATKPKANRSRGMNRRIDKPII